MFSPKVCQVISFNSSHCSQFNKVYKKTQSFHRQCKHGFSALRRTVMAKDPNQFGLEEGEPMIVDPGYLSNDVTDSASCSSPEY